MFESFEESYSLDLHSLKLLQLNKCLQKIFHALILQIILFYEKKIFILCVLFLCRAYNKDFYSDFNGKSNGAAKGARSSGASNGTHSISHNKWIMLV